MSDNTKYVKLTAKPNTWFKAGTEVYDYDCSWEDKFRISLDQWEKDWLPSDSVCARGIRICEHDSERITVGEEYFDGELCSIDEFNVEIVGEKYAR